mmetsp:Transcript_8627/g.14594  ORF Transcript_8627/g.14594 Transcript_8627/m.14594 type:complete len:80 (+) Transcript_8627:1-240(+)
MELKADSDEGEFKNEENLKKLSKRSKKDKKHKHKRKRDSDEEDIDLQGLDTQQLYQKLYQSELLPVQPEHQPTPAAGEV